MASEKTIESSDVRVASCHSDAGDCYKVKCPECGDDVLLAEHGWWDTRCSCGYSWELRLSAAGSVWVSDE